MIYYTLQTMLCIDMSQMLRAPLPARELPAMDFLPLVTG
jgi:hypothetical protein